MIDPNDHMVCECEVGWLPVILSWVKVCEWMTHALVIPSSILFLFLDFDLFLLQLRFIKTGGLLQRLMVLLCIHSSLDETTKANTGGDGFSQSHLEFHVRLLPSVSLIDLCRADEEMSVTVVLQLLCHPEFRSSQTKHHVIREANC